MRGEGVFLIDEDGRRYLDACGGAFVANIGHGVSAIGEAMAAQARCVGYVNGTAFTTAPVEELARELANVLPGDLEKVLFLTSGSEAVEAALKLARQYWVERGRPEKHKIVALEPSYHGATLLALSAGAREHSRRLFGEWLVDVARVPAPYAYRCPCHGEDSRCAACSAQALEDAIMREGADTVAAFIAEPVGGSSTGASVPRADYFRRVREICDRHDVLFVADEVLTGVGRTGSWWGIEAFGVAPDLLTLGKGIAGGYAPLSAVAAPRRIVDVIARGSGAPLHAQTFSQHAVLCAAGLATVRYLREHDLIARAARMGTALHRALDALHVLPHVGDVRGRGLLAGIELVADRATREPFPRDARVAETFTAAAERAGLVVWPNTGHAAGGRGDIIMLAPPFVITEDEIRALVERLVIAYHDAMQSVGEIAGTT